jgi:TolB-like protein/DNA-binding winged helix-turn-helix (wHTH) protein/Flp pilus assembly protein TadD
MSAKSQRFYEFGPFRLDTSERLLTRAGEAVALTPKAFDTLVVLVERRGRLIGKDELMEALWPGSAVEEANLTNNVYALRKAMGEGRDGQRYIETVPKHGYRFVSDVREPPEAEDVLVVEKHSFTRVVTEVEGSAVGGLPRTEELRRLDAAVPSAPVYTRRRVPTLLIIAGACLVLLGAAAALYLYRSWRGEGRVVAGAEETSPPRTIAVLPLINDGGDAEGDYLSDGLSESLINSLSQVPGLKVIARSSSFKYKGQEIDPREAARALGVQAVLTGRVTQRGDRLLVSAELMDARDGTQIWGDRYTRTTTDVQTVQREMVRAIAEKLRLSLSGGDEQVLAKGYPANARAYLLYLKGRHHYFQTTQAEIRKAIGFYQQAIDADPEYTLAYAGMADAYRTLPVVGWDASSGESLPRAKAAAERALEINGGLPEAHIVLGWIAMSFDWDWEAAEGRLKRAVELSPNNADAHRAYAHLLSNLGRHDEALAEAARARELDPLSLITNALEGQFLMYAGRDGEAINRLNGTLDIDPDYWVAHNGLGRVYILQRRYDDAIDELTKARDLSGGSIEPTTQLGYALAKSGRHERAGEVLEELRSRAATDHVPAYSFAMIYNGMGEKVEALQQLERSLQAREVQVTFIKVDTRWDWLRDEPRFRELMRRVGLPQ